MCVSIEVCMSVYATKCLYMCVCSHVCVCIKVCTYVCMYWSVYVLVCTCTSPIKTSSVLFPLLSSSFSCRKELPTFCISLLEAVTPNLHSMSTSWFTVMVWLMAERDIASRLDFHCMTDRLVNSSNMSQSRFVICVYVDSITSLTGCIIFDF